MTNLKIQAHAIAMERYMVDIDTSILNTIKLNLTNLLMEEFDEIDPISAQILKATWREEIKCIGLELIKRN